MPRYLVTTHSTFENIQEVIADNPIEASSNIYEQGNDFFQKHLQEVVVDIEEIPEQYDLFKECRSRGYL